MDYPEDGSLPAGLPSPESIRRLATYLADQVPVSESLALARGKDYTAIHELAGYHEAIDSMRGIADALDEAERVASKAESVSL